MMQLISDVVGRTPTTLIPTIERYLFGNQRTQLNRLAALATTGQTGVTFGFALDGVRPGAYVELGDEIVYVWEATTAAKTATIERAMLGSTAAQYSTGTVARVEPRFMRVEMLSEIVKEIRSWPTNLYARYAGELTLGSSDTAVDLQGFAAVEGAALLRVQLSPGSSSRDARWARLEGVRLERRQSTSGFPTGYALVLPGAVGVSGLSVQVSARAPFDTASLTATTDFGIIGLTHDLVDIIPWGVAGRMLMTRDVARTDANAQGRSRPAEEVRAGDAVNVGKAMLDMRERLLVEAANRRLAEDGMGWA